MCFSATASFVASGGLALVGVASLKIAPRKKRVLAVIPFLFAAQQALEGIQWLALGSGTTCQAAGYGYLFFALILWPVLIPALVYWFDPISRRRMRGFLAIGILVATGYASVLLTGPLGIQAVQNHVVYHFSSPLGPLSVLLYGVAVIGSLWASSIQMFRRYGVIIFAAGLAAMTSMVFLLCDRECPDIFFRASLEIILKRTFCEDKNIGILSR
jgi:hypothetical protein